MSKSYFAPPVNKELSDLVEKLVCHEFNVMQADLFFKTRKRELVLARQAYYYIMKEELSVSPISLARYLDDLPGTDRATILHGAKTCYNDMLYNRSHRFKMEGIIKNLNNRIAGRSSAIDQKKYRSWIPTIKNHRSKMVHLYMMNKGSHML